MEAWLIIYLGRAVLLLQLNSNYLGIFRENNSLHSVRSWINGLDKIEASVSCTHGSCLAKKAKPVKH